MISENTKTMIETAIMIDGGMTDNIRPALYQAQYSAQIANKKNEEKFELVTVAGKCCESGDILIKDIELNSPTAGDILCVFNTGAYCYSMSSNYNRIGRPPIVMLNNGVPYVAVKRETLDDIIKNDI